MKVLRLTLYQIIRAIIDGKRVYTAKKKNVRRFFWSSSLDQAQSKFLKWKVRKVI